MVENAVRMVCGKCRSEQVTRDAWAEWNPAGQQWVLGAVFDYAYCHRCQGPAPVATVPVELPAAP
ncbi:MAG: hypothetical protein LBV50_01730 [Novosphingobium sp.]|jgi:hypothetical protein|nr:hypothetical protein [Novosphingobium sp.]